MHTDGNLPAALQVMAFLGSAMAAGVLALVALYGFARKKSWAKKTVGVLVGGIGLYFLLLAGFSVVSHDENLSRGEEKAFCEIDCHLAYSVARVQWIGEGAARELEVTVQTRFDEKTISAHRPKDAPLTPNPRKVELVDGAGRSWAPSEVQGMPLTKELVPGESYATTFVFPVEQEQAGLRLLITSSDGPMQLLIGNEMSWGHKKTYLEL